MPDQTSVVSFNFATQSVRIVMRNDDPWFVATDVCAALCCNTEQTRRLDDDEKGLHSMQTPGGNQEVTIINESGLYSLILTSRKPEAKKFKKWVTSEVLPSIRKTGSYSLAPTTAIIAAQPPMHLALNRAMRTMGRHGNDAFIRLMAYEEIQIICGYLGLKCPPAHLIGKPYDQLQMEV